MARYENARRDTGSRIGLIVTPPPNAEETHQTKTQ
jgi:hypothetical protein